MFRTLFQYLFIILYMLLASGCFNLLGWGESELPKLYYLFSGFVFLYFIVNIPIINKQRSPFKITILLLFIIPIISIFWEQIYWFEPLKEELTTFLLSFSFLIYFVFKNKQFKEKNIIGSFIVVASIVLMIQIFQSFFPDKAIFGIADSESGHIALKRNDIYRFNLLSYSVTIFVMYFFWSKFLNTFKVVWFLFFLIFFVSMYLYLTRQIMVASVVTMFISIFYMNNRRKRLYAGLSFLIIGLIFGIYFYEELWKNLVDDSLENTYSIDQRLLSMAFYMEKSFDDPILLFVGHCHPAEYLEWQPKLHFWASDVGFIGELYQYGLIWVMIYFFFLHRILKKYHNYIPMYIKLTLIGTFINSIFIFPYRNGFEVMIWVALIYISELYIKDKMHDQIKFFCYKR